MRTVLTIGSIVVMSLMCWLMLLGITALAIYVWTSAGWLVLLAVVLATAFITTAITLVGDK
jgi:hypothetical protein